MRPRTVVLGAAATLGAVAFAFHHGPPVVRSRPPTPRSALRAADVGSVEDYLAEAYPSFSALVSLTGDDLWKKLRAAQTGITVFAPNAAAFEALGDKRRQQLWDVRNGEAAEKMAAYHLVNEPVSRDALLNAGGIVTLGGELPVGQTTSGGLFGFGAKEDGGVTVNQASVVSTVEVGTSVVHEVDAFVSPQLLWRYMDQLRIPGSQ